MKLKHSLPAIVFISTFLFPTANSFSQNWKWARQGVGGSEGFGVATDTFGNVFVSGTYWDNIAFGTYNFNHSAAFTFVDIFLVKYDACGNVLWAISSGPDGVAGTSANCITTDASGNVYLTGYYQSPTIKFGTVTLTNSTGGFKEAFLVKYDPCGKLLWAKNAAVSHSAHLDARGITTDISGNVYLSGDFSSPNVNFGSTTLTSATFYNEVFTAKYDQSGNLLWAKGSKGGGGTSDIAVDPSSGNVIITGGFGGLPTIAFGAFTLAKVGTGDMFLVQYNAAGTEQWAQIAGIPGGNNISASSIAIDLSGNIFLTGNFSSPSANIGSYTLNFTGGSDVFLSKYNSSGNVLWAQAGGLVVQSTGYGLATDASGNVYLTGSFSEFDPIHVSFGPCCMSFGFNAFSLSIPSFGTLGGQNDKFFVFKLDPNGNVLCADALISGGDDESSAAIDPDGNLYIVSDFDCVRYPSFNIGTNTLNIPSGSEEVFVAKWNCSSNIIPNCSFYANATVSNPSCNSSCSGTITVSPAGGFSPYTYSWSNGASSQIISGVCAGMYTVTVTDMLSCKPVTAATNVVTASTLSGQFTKGTASCAGCGCKEWVMITAAGGTSPYSYSWPDGYDKRYKNHLCPGAYTINIKDKNGCSIYMTLIAP